MIFLIVLLLLLPLMLFSSDSSALVSNPVKYASMDVNLVIMGEPLSLYSFSRSADIVAANRTEYYRWQDMFKGRRSGLGSFVVDGKTVLLPKWTTESQIVNIPSIVLLALLSKSQSNHPWAVLEEYTQRVVDIIKSDCSSVQLDLQVMFDRDLPSVPRSLAPFDRVGGADRHAEDHQDAEPDAVRHAGAHAGPQLRRERLQRNPLAGLRASVSLLFLTLQPSYPRVYFLNSANEPVSYDSDESKFNSLEIELKASRSSLFGVQYFWEVRSDTPDTADFQNGVLFWVINETQLSRSRRRGLPS